MKRILIIGGGYAGFYAAWKLEGLLRSDEASVTLVDPRGYMTYQPFLPELSAGSVEPRHVAVAHRRHLRRTELRRGWITRVDHEHRRATFRSISGVEQQIEYDLVIVTAGAVTRTFPIPGLRDHAIGMKNVEEAVAVHDRLLRAFELATVTESGPERDRLLTVTVIGGGFTGVEVFGELYSLATALAGRRYPQIRREELRFHLIEATDRILPEVTAEPGRWVVDHLRRRGASVHLRTQLTSLDDGVVVLSDGTTFASFVTVWAAGNAANPVVARHTDLPVDERGYLTARADLRVVDGGSLVDDAWAAGDAASIPDLVTGRRAVPNAQHAVRQGKLLARNVVAVLRGAAPRDYRHHGLGVVATLGMGRGIFQWHRLVVTGLPAWIMHRGYHVLAIPSVERKVRVLAVWITAFFFGRDIVALPELRTPRDAFRTGGEPPARVGAGTAS